MAPLPELYERLLQPLNTSGIQYVVTGGLAAIVYGEPRLTNDVDLVVHLVGGDAERLHAAFTTTEYYLPPLEVIERESARDSFGHFNVLHIESALRADIYCVGNDAFGKWALQNRRFIAIASEQIALAPIEYVIVQKLRYLRESGSERHLRDIVAMRRVSGDLIDLRALDRWVQHLGVKAEWARVLDAQ